MRPFIVCLSGATCTGKSTIGGSLARRENVLFVPEPDPSALLMQMLESRDISAHAIQTWIVCERNRRIFEALDRGTSAQIIIIDRALSEDRAVFFRFHHQMGLLSDDELRQLEKLFWSLPGSVLLPDFTLFFSADRGTLAGRLRARPEGSWLHQHLDLQLRLYDDYRSEILNLGHSVMIIDTSGDNLDSVSERSRRCWEDISRMRSANPGVS